MTDLTGDPTLPSSAQIAPNGQRFTKICFFDFNSLYLFVQQLSFPATPGILWTKHRKKFFYKKIMASGNSMQALQWLSYVDEYDPRLQSSNGQRVKLQHQYYRGEHEIGGFKIDGYAEVDGEKLFYEFLGCWFHDNCEHCSTTTGRKDSTWERKRAFLERQGTLIVMRECLWKKKIRQEKLKSVRTLKIPRVLNPFSNEFQLLEGIKSGELFGFLVADVKTSENLRKKLAWINFPPIIRRHSIDADLLTPYMKKRVKDRGFKLPQVSPIQTYNGEQLLLYTPLVIFYMELGLEVSNVSTFLQYRESSSLQKFCDKITSGRCQAKRDRNSQLELAYKIIGSV